MIKAFTQEDIWHPTYNNSSEESQKEMRLLACPVEIQCNKFIEENVTTVHPLSITSSVEITGGFQTPIKTKTTLYLLYTKP